MPIIAEPFRPELLPSPAAFYTHELRKMGRKNFRGWVLALCPFHPDRHPSLSVNLETSGFYCFSCGEKGGDIVGFLMKRDGVLFKEAAQSLGVWHEDHTLSACMCVNFSASETAIARQDRPISHSNEDNSWMPKRRPFFIPAAHFHDHRSPLDTK